MLQTMQDMQNLGQKADSGAKPNVLQTIIKAIAAFAPPPNKNQIDTKIGGFKKDLKNWIRLNDMSGFGKDPITGAVVASEEQWEELLAVKSNKDAYGKFKNKPLANEELLYTLFLDSLATGAHVATPQDIAYINQMENEKDADAKGEEKESEPHIEDGLPLNIDRSQKELYEDEEIDAMQHDQRMSASTISTPTTPISIARTPLSASSSTASLKRLALDQSSSSKKKAKPTGPELIHQAIGGLAPLMTSISASIAAEAKSWQERASKIVQEHYTDLSEDDRLILADIIEEEAKARTFALLKPQTLQRRWVENRIGERTAWRNTIGLPGV